MACRVCGDPKTVAKNRCHCCYEYKRRTGADRTERHVIKLTERDVDRALADRYR